MKNESVASRGVARGFGFTLNVNLTSPSWFLEKFDDIHSGILFQVQKVFDDTFIENSPPSPGEYLSSELSSNRFVSDC